MINGKYKLSSYCLEALFIVTLVHEFFSAIVLLYGIYSSFHHIDNASYRQHLLPFANCSWPKEFVEMLGSWRTHPFHYIHDEFTTIDAYAIFWTESQFSAFSWITLWLFVFFPFVYVFLRSFLFSHFIFLKRIMILVRSWFATSSYYDEEGGWKGERIAKFNVVGIGEDWPPKYLMDGAAIMRKSRSFFTFSLAHRTIIFASLPLFYYKKAPPRFAVPKICSH